MNDFRKAIGDSDTSNQTASEFTAWYPSEAELAVCDDLFGTNYWNVAAQGIPDVTLIMRRAAGKYGAQILVRFDNLRERNNFTIIDGRFRVCDTDEPIRALCKWIYNEYITNE